MNIEQKYVDELAVLKELFYEAYEQAGGKSHRYFHCLRVAYNTEHLASKLNEKIGNMDLLIVAAIFHDIGKANRQTKDGYLDGSQKADLKFGDHTKESLVLELLQEHIGNKYKIEELQYMAKIISGNIEGSETKIIMDADNLDEVGLVNIWKMFTYGGFNKVNIKDTIDYYLNEDQPRLIKKCEEKLNFSLSKEIASKRMAKVDKFLKDFINESIAEDI